MENKEHIKQLKAEIHNNKMILLTVNSSTPLQRMRAALRLKQLNRELNKP